MNQEKLKNIVVLRDIPSNLVEEAIIILKDNNQINKKKLEEYAKDDGKNIVKEYLKNNSNKHYKNKKIAVFRRHFVVSVLFFVFFCVLTLKFFLLK